MKLFLLFFTLFVNGCGNNESLMQQEVSKPNPIRDKNSFENQVSDESDEKIAPQEKPLAPSTVIEKNSYKNAPFLALTIEEDGMKKLNEKKAQTNSVLIKEDNDWVLGTIETKSDGIVPVKIRLKGDWTDHIWGNHFSLRVKVLENKSVFGLKIFSLQKIERRGWGEALLNLQMKKLGILAPQYFYLDYHFNDLEPILFALEEHYSEGFLTSQERPISPIFTVDEDLLWRQRALNVNNGLLVNAIMPYVSYFLPFRFYLDDNLKDESFRNSVLDGLGFLRGERESLMDLPIDEALFGKYYAVLQLWQTNHGLIFHNRRQYYNSKTHLFEPVSFDNGVVYKKEIKSNYNCLGEGVLKFYNPYSHDNLRGSINILSCATKEIDNFSPKFGKAHKKSAYPLFSL